MRMREKSGGEVSGSKKQLALLQSEVREKKSSMKAEPSGGAGDFKATEKHKGSLYSLLKGKRLSNPQ